MAAPRRWMTWALVASLALNLAALGMIGGAWLKGPPPPNVTLWHYARALPEPYRRDLGRALRDSRDGWRGPRDALHDQRDAFAAALTAEPYESGKVASILERQTALTDELSRRATEVLVSQIDRMSPQERAAYATALQEPRGRPTDRHREGDDQGKH